MKKHFTATVYIVATIDGAVRVLLHKHKHHKIWLGVGGHVEASENPEQAAIREAKEETGINVQLIKKKQPHKFASDVSEVLLPQIILEEYISKRIYQNPHYHIDCIYLGTTRTPEKVTMNEPFKWFSLADLKKEKLNKEVRFIATRAIELGKNVLCSKY